MDSLLDSKIKALDVLDESNKAKNAIYGIDPSKSRTSEFLSGLVSKKIQSASSSIGPLINSASTLFSGASAGLANAVVSKIAPLSSLSGGLSGGGGISGGGAGMYKYGKFSYLFIPTLVQVRKDTRKIRSLISFFHKYLNKNFL